MSIFLCTPCANPSNSVDNEGRVVLVGVQCRRMMVLDSTEYELPVPRTFRKIDKCVKNWISWRLQTLADEISLHQCLLVNALPVYRTAGHQCFFVVECTFISIITTLDSMSGIKYIEFRLAIAFVQGSTILLEHERAWTTAGTAWYGCVELSPDL